MSLFDPLMEKVGSSSAHLDLCSHVVWTDEDLTVVRMSGDVVNSGGGGVVAS